MKRFRRELARRLDQKGKGTFASKHEILGVLTEEMDEFRAAVHNKLYFDVNAKLETSGQQMESELMDIAVGAVFGAICIREGTIEW